MLELVLVLKETETGSVDEAGGLFHLPGSCSTKLLVPFVTS